MQHARQTAPQTKPARRKRTRLRPAGPQDGPGPASPARDLQDALRTAYGDAVRAPEPTVPSWPGWAKLGVLAAGATLTWAGLIGVAKLLL